jgi:hypothetical protein
MKILFPVLLLCAALWSHETLKAATNAASGSVRADEMFDTLGPILGENARTSLRNQVRDPDTLNALVMRLQDPMLQKSNALFGIVNDLHLKFKVFDTTSSGQDAALGLAYDYDKALMGHTLRSNTPDPISMSFNVAARGNVAFDRTENPDDFLDSKVQFHFFQAIGGMNPTISTEAQAAELQQALLDAAKVRNIPPEQFDASPEWRAVKDRIIHRLNTQYFWDLSGNAGLESDQSFVQKQWVYGAQLGGVVRAWNPDSALARFNLFDWPFAMLRYLTGADAQWRPSGQAIPSVLGGIDLVDPTDNTDRVSIDPDENGAFPRYRVEVAFKTKVARLMDKDVWFASSLRHFQEIGASRAIRAADLDRQTYFAASLEFPGGFSLNYSAGRLPLDRETDHVYALGYTLKF